MRRTLAFVVLGLVIPVSASAQPADLVITNARVITGTGEVFDQAFVIVTDGRIVSVASGMTVVQAAREIDATGLTVLPGLVDTHRHFLVGSRADSAEALGTWMDENLPSMLEDLLADGITTTISLGDYHPAILEVRRRLEEGELTGPRLLAVGKGFAAPDDWPLPLLEHSAWSRSYGIIETTESQAARDDVRELAEAGVDGVKAVLDETLRPDARLSDVVLEVIADETERIGIPLFTHAETVDNMLTAVGLGSDRLVHMPHTGRIADTAGARQLREEGVAISTTVSFGTEAMAEVRGQPRSAVAIARHEQRLENIRYLWDEGVTVAFGTDSPPGLDIMAEVRALQAVLSNEGIITALTRNAAVFLYLGDELGTLEAGKIADLVIVDGDPLADIEALANVRMVIQGGEVVVDNR